MIGRFSSILSFCFVAILIDGSEKCDLWLNFLLLSLHVFEKRSKEKVDTSYCVLALLISKRKMLMCVVIFNLSYQ